MPADPRHRLHSPVRDLLLELNTSRETAALDRIQGALIQQVIMASIRFPENLPLQTKNGEIFWEFSSLANKCLDQRIGRTTVREVVNRLGQEGCDPRICLGLIYVISSSHTGAKSQVRWAPIDTNTLEQAAEILRYANSIPFLRATIVLDQPVDVDAWARSLKQYARRINAATRFLARIPRTAFYRTAAIEALGKHIRFHTGKDPSPKIWEAIAQIAISFGGKEESAGALRQAFQRVTPNRSGKPEHNALKLS